MKATLTVLGSGTSMGVPTLGCGCAVCRSADPHDRRTRPSVMIEYGGKVVLIDTTPDFYAQAIREHITRVDAVFYTHTHADHILGIDDLRPLSFRHKPEKLPLYARPEAAAFLRKMFSYIFDADYKFGTLPQLELRPIDGPIEVLGVRFDPTPARATGIRRHEAGVRDIGAFLPATFADADQATGGFLTSGADYSRRLIQIA